MNDVLFWSYLLALPAAMLVSVAVFGWRYRDAVAKSMTRFGAAAVVPPEAVPSATPIEPIHPLRIDRGIAAALLPLTGDALAAFDRALAATRAVDRRYLLAGGCFWGAVVALHLWSAPAKWPAAALPLVAVLAALPGLIVGVGAVARSWRPWCVVGATYVALLAASILALASTTHAFSGAVAAVSSLAALYAPPGLAMLLLIQRRLRTLVVGIVPILLFLAVGVVAIGLAVDVGVLPSDVGTFKQRPEFRWPSPVLYGLGLAAVPVGVWLFLRILRSQSKLGPTVVLASIGVAGVALDHLAQPRFPLGPLAAAIPAAVLQCFVVWLVFKGLVVLEGARWLSSRVLQFHLCWLVLAIYSTLVLDAQLQSTSAIGRQAVYGLYGAIFVGYLVLLHALLRKAWSARTSIPPRRLLLLRVFGTAGKRERLLDSLEDTWRRIGRVDLIAGTDLAMRTLGSWMLECFLLQRVDGEFLRSNAEVDRRLARMRSELEGDLCFPVNEVCCYVDTWSTAVVTLAAAADLVLLDLRGFTRKNRGCVFELTHLIWRVELERVVVLCDNTTDEGALDEVAHAAWATLPDDSPNASALAPRLMMVCLGRSSTVEPMTRALFRAAFPGAVPRLVAALR